MASSPYSFIDIVVMDEVRVRFAAGDALAILAVDLDSVIWANGPAAELFGFADIEAIMGARAGLGFAAKRQIAAAPGFPRIGRDRPALVRLASGMNSRAVPFLVSGVTMPDGEPAILLALPANAAGASAPDMVADRVIAGFREAGYFAALVGQDAKVLAASNGFGALGLPAEILAQLVHEVAGEQDRLIKRMVRADGGSIPAGIARLTDEPALHLLVVVDEREEAGETETGEAPAAGHAPPPEPPAPSDADIVEFIEEGAATATFEAGEDETARDRQSQPSETSFGVAPAPPAVPDDADADDWYFRDHGERRRGERRAQPPATSATPPPEAAAPAQVTALPTTPVRFVWRTDAEGAFSAISSEFASAVGPRAADVIGRRFRDVATVFGLDPSGEIADLLERRDTWSGRSVLWPIAGTDLKVPVDLAALPVYSRDRTFEGFRGFGVARMGDAVTDPEALGLTLVSGAKAEPAPPPAPAEEAPHEDEAPTTEDPFRGETPVISIAGRRERRASDKIIRLAEHRPQVPEKTLSASERSALDEIRAKLRKDYETQRELERTQPGQLTEAGEPATVEPKDAPERDEPSKPEAGRARGGEDLSFGSTDDGDQHPVAVGDEADEPVSDEIYDEPHFRALDDVTEAAEPASDDTAAPAAAVTPAHAPPIPLSGFTPSAFWSDSDGGVDADLVSGLPLPVLIHAGDELYFANREFLKLTGFASLNQIRREGGLDGLFAERADEDAARGPDGAKLRLRTLGGEEFPVDAHLQSIRWRGGSALLLALRRVAEVRQVPVRQQAPRSDFIGIEETETRVEEMRAIIDTATDGVVLIANDGTIRNISRPAEALFGFDSAAVEGKPFSSLFAIESQRAARDYLNGLSENGVASVLNDGREVIGREAEGRFIPLFMTIGRLPNDSGFCAVVRDITQWKRAEEELTQARSLAERSSSQKTEFLARVSHEIRTPLNAIIGFSELMIDEKFGPIGSDRYRDYLRDINRSGNHVLDLVNDLLDISKIEAGEQEMNYEAVSLNDTLAEAVAMMQPQANRDRVIIRSSLASRLPEVVADLRSVRQIALNLLSNAIRYTQAGGQVIVSTSYETSGDVTMRVRDTGVGMTLGEIDQALKPFKQINALRRGRRDGTGLGLPLTKAMVEANRARFSIASTPSEGTLVEITFPSTRVLAD